MIRTLTFACVILATASATTAAQRPQYRRSPRDTLHYRESTTNSTQSETPAGSMAMSMNTHSLLSLTFVAGDTVKLWYDSVDMKVESPMGSPAGLGQDLVGKPFLFLMDAQGRISSVSTPTIMGPTGALPLRPALDQWFARLPKQSGPLTIGQAWQDSVVTEMDPAPGMHTRNTAVIHYRVVRDSTVSGQKALVLETRSNLTVNGSGSMGGTTVVSVMRGEETGTILYAPDPGLLLSRVTRVKMEGTTDMSGGTPMSMSTRSDITTTFQLVRK